MRPLLFLLLLLSLNALGQTAITGVVRDSKTNEPLPFATIKPNNSNAIAADVDGKFIIASGSGVSQITVSYTGYRTATVNISSGQRHYIIKLTSQMQEISSVVIESENPANAIIREAVRRKPQNDPLKKLSSFKYKSYEKLTVTANPDSITDRLDSIYIYERIGRRFEKIDSSFFKFRKLVQKRHLYQTEKVSEIHFNKEQGLKENILATRMAGFKEPVYEIIALKLQPYSVYEDIDLVESKYEGPLSSEKARYRYKILDTVSIENRPAFAVYFTPKRKSKKFRLEGVLYIDTQTYGVSKVVFRVKNVLDITATHQFAFNAKEQLWFPKSRTLHIVKGNNNRSINLLGERITFDATEEDSQNRQKETSDYMYLISESRNFDEEFNIPLTIKHAAVAIEIDKEAINRPESYWNMFRGDSLDIRSAETYPALDSIIERENYEKLIKLGRSILNGYIPVGAVNLDWRQIVRYNVHEGFRLGIGGATNAKFSEIFRITGYGAYGFKDRKFKYSLGGAIRLDRFTNTWIGGAYTDDLREIGSIRFETDKPRFRIYDNRPLNVSTFYNYRSWSGYIESRQLARTESRLEIAHTKIDPRFDYLFVDDGVPRHIFALSTATFAIQWNPFSEYMQTPDGRLETDKRFPKFAFQFTKSFGGFMEGDFSFSKADFRTEYEKKYLNGQKTALLVQAGVAVGDTPLTHLYSLMPNSRDKETIGGRLRFAGKNSFETMYFNEFFSSQYVIFQAKHAMGKYNIYRQINMSPVLVTRFAWGNMEHKNEHLGVEFNTLEKGYYESGIELNNIYKIIGITGFYRYGPYHLPEFTKNIAVKISVIVNLL